MRTFFGIVALFVLSACGQSSGPGLDPTIATNTFPLLTRVAPTAGKPGDTITLFGSGFSEVATENIVNIGGATMQATNYALVDPPAVGEVESLTATVPAAVPVGIQSIFVIVFENTTNTDLTFTVTP